MQKYFQYGIKYIYGIFCKCCSIKMGWNQEYCATFSTESEWIHSTKTRCINIFINVTFLECWRVSRSAFWDCLIREEWLNWGYLNIASFCTSFSQKVFKSLFWERCLHRLKLRNALYFHLLILKIIYSLNRRRY